MDGQTRFVPAGVLAARYGVSTASIRQAALEGKIPSIRLGEKTLLFDAAAVELALVELAEVRGKNSESTSLLSSAPLRTPSDPTGIASDQEEADRDEP